MASLSFHSISPFYPQNLFGLKFCHLSILAQISIFHSVLLHFDPPKDDLHNVTSNNLHNVTLQNRKKGQTKGNLQKTTLQSGRRKTYSLNFHIGSIIFYIIILTQCISRKMCWMISYILCLMIVQRVKTMLILEETLSYGHKI